MQIQIFSTGIMLICGHKEFLKTFKYKKVNEIGEGKECHKSKSVKKKKNINTMRVEMLSYGMFRNILTIRQLST